VQLVVHALAGAALGTQTVRPVLAVVAGIVSHVLLDELPHRDTKHPIVIAADLAAALVLLGVLAADARTLPAAVGGLGGMLPDVEFLLMAAHWRTPHQSIIPHHRVGDPVRPTSRLTNAFVQGAVVTASLLVLLGALG